MLTSSAIKARAHAVGFDVCGVAAAAPFPELAGFADWLARGFAGEMAWLPRTAGARLDVRQVLPSAQSVIVLATVYNTDRPYSVEETDPGIARISRYAWGDDYHDIVGARLDQLADWMRAAHGESIELRRYVDTGPVQERAWAARAGVGWVGKNACVIHPGLGSWLFLGVILCSIRLEADPPAFDQCGACTLCLVSCPTGAIVEPRVVDSSRCLSYLTIERRGPFSDEERAMVGAQVFGCDVCQDVCPWNGRAAVSGDPAWQPRVGLDRARISALARLDDEALGALTRKSALRRTTLDGLRRNLAAAASNAARERV